MKLFNRFVGACGLCLALIACSGGVEVPEEGNSGSGGSGGSDQEVELPPCDYYILVEWDKNLTLEEALNYCKDYAAFINAHPECARDNPNADQSLADMLGCGLGLTAFCAAEPGEFQLRVTRAYEDGNVCHPMFWNSCRSGEC